MLIIIVIIIIIIIKIPNFWFSFTCVAASAG